MLKLSTAVRQSLRIQVTVTVISLLLIMVDYLTGPHSRFPITFVIPVAVAAWMGADRSAYLWAVMLPLLRFWLGCLPGEEVDPVGYMVLNNLVRMAVLLLVASVVIRFSGHYRALQEEVRLLRAMGEICADCAQVRIAPGKWQPLDDYARAHPAQCHTPTYCPECAAKRSQVLLSTAGLNVEE